MENFRLPIVLHGSSSVPEEEVETINKYGGALKAAIGIPKKNCVKLLSLLFAKSTSTQTLVWLQDCCYP